MADQQQRRVSPPGDLDQRLGGGAHLRDRAGRRLKAVEMHGLDRIHYRHLAPLGEGGRDVARRRGGCKRNGRIRHAEASRPHRDLGDGLLAGDIEAVMAPGRQLRSGLQQKGGLADAGIAADEARSFPAPARRPAPGRTRRCRWRGARREAAPHRAPPGRACGPPVRLLPAPPLPRQGCSTPRSLRSAPTTGAAAAPAGLADIAAVLAAHRRTAMRIGPVARPWMNWSTWGSPLPSISETGPDQTIRPSCSMAMRSAILRALAMS